MKNYVCPVCGYPNLEDPPRLEGSPSEEICPSCFFQFGFDDDSEGYTYEQWRQAWIHKGMPWSGKADEEPDGWDPRDQLTRLWP